MFDTGRRSTTQVAQAGLLDISSLDAVDEELLPLMGRISGALVKGVVEEEHGIEHHPARPHICWPPLIRLLLPHICQHFWSCRAPMLVVLLLQFGDFTGCQHLVRSVFCTA